MTGLSLILALAAPVAATGADRGVGATQTEEKTCNSTHCRGYYERFKGKWALVIEAVPIFTFKINPAKPGVSVEWCFPSQYRIAQNGTFYDLAGPRKCAALSGSIKTEQDAHVLELRDIAPNGDATSGSVRFLVRFTSAAVPQAVLAMPGLRTPYPLRPLDFSANQPPQWGVEQSYYAFEDMPSDPQIAILFAEDQKDRAIIKQGGDLKGVAERDAARRELLFKILGDGRTRSGRDYEYAAFIFQHGTDPKDFILAHALADLAMARGRSGAEWIARASLDRYLQSLGLPQIYGTQFKRDVQGNRSLAPIDRAVLPDWLRTIDEDH